MSKAVRRAEKKKSMSKGDELLAQMAALANPHRLRIIRALHASGRNYVRQLARESEISRPLLHLHLQKFEESGLVKNRLKISENGKALNYFVVTDFILEINPTNISISVESMSNPHPQASNETEVSESLDIFTLVLVAVTCVLIFGVRAFAAVQTARTGAVREAAYRDLAAKANAAQDDAIGRLATLQTDLTSVGSRLAAIEKMLRSVE